MKKGLLFISICAICVILGQIGRMSFGNVGLADVKNLEDLKRFPFILIMQRENRMQKTMREKLQQSM